MSLTENTPSVSEKTPTVSGRGRTRSMLGRAMTTNITEPVEIHSRRYSRASRLYGHGHQEHFDIEVRVTVRRCGLQPPPAHFGHQSQPAALLTLTDTRLILSSLGASKPALMPVAFKATPNEALVDALLDLAFDAVDLRRPAQKVRATPDG